MLQEKKKKRKKRMLQDYGTRSISLASTSKVQHSEISKLFHGIWNSAKLQFLQLIMYNLSSYNSRAKSTHTQKVIISNEFRDNNSLHTFVLSASAKQKYA